MRAAAVIGVGLILLLTLAWSALLGRTKTVALGENVHVLVTNGLLGPIGANVTVVTDAEGTLVVDAQLRPLAKRIQGRIEGLGGGPIQYLVNTHWHPDHTGGNEVLQVAGEIVAHSNVRARRSVTQEGFGLTKPSSHHVFSPLPAAALPTRSADEDITLVVGDLTVEIRHLPGAHSDGDLAVYIPAQGVVVVGDVVWPGSFPFLDTPSGGSADGLASALNTLLDWVAPGTRIVPGHGAVMDYDEFLDYRTFVLLAIEAVRTGPVGDVALEEAQEIGLSEEFGRWGSTLVPVTEWIRMVRGESPGR
jgi:cyclase